MQFFIALLVKLFPCSTRTKLFVSSAKCNLLLWWVWGPFCFSYRFKVEHSLQHSWAWGIVPEEDLYEKNLISIENTQIRDSKKQNLDLSSKLYIMHRIWYHKVIEKQEEFLKLPHLLISLKLQTELLHLLLRSETASNKHNLHFFY